MNSTRRLRFALRLETLGQKDAKLLEGLGTVYAEAAMISLESNGHLSPTDMDITGHHNCACRITGPAVTPPMRKRHAEPDKAAEEGAYGVAIPLIEKLESLTVVEQARKGTGFDWWFLPRGAPTPDQQNFLKGTMMLEVSGIRKGDDPRVMQRVAKKRKQVNKRPEDLSGFIVVIEFGRPIARVEKV